MFGVLPTWLGFLLTVAGLVGGVALALASRRMRSVDNHPTCRGCAFDLIGLNAAVKCPECGRSLAGRRAIIMGNRRTNHPCLLAGVVVAVGALVLGGPGTVRAVRSMEMERFKPVWWLREESRGDDASRVQSAVLELLRREHASGLSRRTWDGLVEDGLAVQADRTRPWASAWGELLADAARDGTMTLSQHERMLANAYEVTVDCRGRVRRGGVVAVLVSFEDPRITPKFEIGRSCRLVEGVVGQSALEPIVPAEPLGRGGLPRGPAEGDFAATLIYTCNAPVGAHELRAAWDVLITDQLGRTGNRRIALARAVEVVGAADPIVRVRREPEVSAAMERALSIVRVRGGDHELVVTLRVGVAPVAFVGDVLVRNSIDMGEPRTEWLVHSQLTFGPTDDGWMRNLAAGEPPHLFLSRPGQLEIVLRPRPDLAEQIPHLAEIWGDDIVLGPVVVEWD